MSAGGRGDTSIIWVDSRSLPSLFFFLCEFDQNSDSDDDYTPKPFGGLKNIDGGRVGTFDDVAIAPEGEAAQFMPETIACV